MLEEEKNKILSLIDATNKKVLDVGCGDGRYAEIFSSICQKYVGIDLDQKLIEQNNSNNDKENVTYLYQNIVNYYPNDKFDLIILSLSFHEIDIKEQGLALINMLNLLTPDGQIMILDPADEKDSFQALWNIAYNCLKFYNHDYSVKHSEEVIAKAIDKHLCKIVKKDKLEIPFSFDNFSQVLEMIINDEEFEYVMDRTNRQDLENMLRYFLNKEENIVIYDKLNITILQKWGN